MKKIFTIIAAVALVMGYTACTSGNKQKSVLEQQADFQSTLNSEDTLQMLKLADDCMELLKNKHFDEAIAMLKEYDEENKQVTDLSPESERRLRRQFEVFPVLRYERDYYSVMLEGLNDVRYKIWFAEENNTAEKGEPVTKMMFNPVKFDGQWYLCVKGHDQGFDELKQ